jgi:1-aminocyclopropane-1-carboxylate deaminase
MFDTKKSIIQKVELPFLNRKGIELFVKRDDLIDDFVSGNKWRKLKYNLALAKANNSAGVLTFGGAYSNHLLATVAACEKMGVPAIGIVRGEELNRNSNSVLSRCATLGMDLQFISRNEYALIHDRMYHEELLAKFPNFHIVPEGGANYYGIIGCQEILSETPNNYDHIFVAQGTTTTSAGLVFGLPAHSICSRVLHCGWILEVKGQITTVSRFVFISSSLMTTTGRILLISLPMVGFKSAK